MSCFHLGVAPRILFVGLVMKDPHKQWRIQDLPERGASTNDFMQFFRKLHEMKKFWPGRDPWRPLDPPLIFALTIVQNLLSHFSESL